MPNVESTNNTSNPAVNAEAITNGVAFSSACRAIYVGGAGGIALELENGTEVFLAAAPAGQILPIRAVRVLSAISGGGSATTATNLVALF